MIYKDESYNIVGAAMAVHKYLGCGFSEKVYQDALEIEFQNRGIPFGREVPMHISYHGVELKSLYIPDFICYDKIIVELKAVKEMDDVFKTQAINYARIGNFKLAILLNFGKISLETEFFPIYANI